MPIFDADQPAAGGANAPDLIGERRMNRARTGHTIAMPLATLFTIPSQPPLYVRQVRPNEK
jgi:hypothetical protein